jgi:hypothetical protein
MANRIDLRCRARAQCGRGDWNLDKVLVTHTIPSRVPVAFNPNKHLLFHSYDRKILVSSKPNLPEFRIANVEGAFDFNLQCPVSTQSK